MSEAITVPSLMMKTSTSTVFPWNYLQGTDRHTQQHTDTVLVLC